jgi:hypothetical protein
LGVLLQRVSSVVGVVGDPGVVDGRFLVYDLTMLSEWEIKARAHQCSRTQERFQDGETIYTLLFRDGGAFRREDVSERAWQAIHAETAPFSFWKSKYEAPPPPAPEPLQKESVEELLRRLIQEDRPEYTNARYVLAVMLERKRILKQVDTQENSEERILIYEHAKTGEAFLIADPRLKLDQLDAVQEEVLRLLKGTPGADATSNAGNAGIAENAGN